MGRKKTKNDTASSPEKPCHVQGCAAPAAYKAPASKDAIHDYHWYCLDHVREYNKQWDFFAGLDGHEIEAFMKDAVTGHRPTWSRESQIGQFDQLHHALNEFIHINKARPAKLHPPLPPKVKNALGLLEVEYPYTEQTLKIQYRQMVKKHHPDMNKGNKESEEKFKKITAAYRILVTHIA